MAVHEDPYDVAALPALIARSRVLGQTDIRGHETQPAWDGTGGSQPKAGVRHARQAGASSGTCRCRWGAWSAHDLGVGYLDGCVLFVVAGEPAGLHRGCVEHVFEAVEVL